MHEHILVEFQQEGRFGKRYQAGCEQDNRGGTVQHMWFLIGTRSAAQRSTVQQQNSGELPDTRTMTANNTSKRQTGRLGRTPRSRCCGTERALAWVFIAASQRNVLAAER